MIPTLSTDPIGHEKSFKYMSPNCKGYGVSSNGEVADFGLTEDMYGTNYFRRERGEGGSEEKVPIRWMAPESIEEDIYTEATDVVRSDNTHHDYCSEVW